MKFKIKKFIYLLNDVTNTLLGKDREELGQELIRLRRILLLVSLILVALVILNIYLII